MRRFIVVSSRVGEEKESKKPVLFLTLYRLPNKTQSGMLWYPKKDDALVVTCINSVSRSDEFNALKDVLPCSLVDVTFGVNEFTNKTIVASIKPVKDTVNIFDPDLLYC